MQSCKMVASPTFESNEAEWSKSATKFRAKAPGAWWTRMEVRCSPAYTITISISLHSLQREHPSHVVRPK